MEDNELQATAQQVKGVQEEISQSRQSLDTKAFIASNLAKATAQDQDHQSLLKGLEKALNLVDASAQELDSKYEKLVSTTERLCKEIRKRRDAAREAENAAREAENAARQAKDNADALMQRLQGDDVSLTCISDLDPPPYGSNTDIHRLLKMPIDKSSKRPSKLSKRNDKPSRKTDKHSGRNSSRDDKPSRRNDKLSSRTD